MAVWGAVCLAALNPTEKTLVKARTLMMLIYAFSGPRFYHVAFTVQISPQLTSTELAV